MRRALALAACALAVVAVPRSAAADDAKRPPGEPEDPRSREARRHFESGLALYDATPPDYAGALAEFKAAYHDKPTPGLKQNIALCYKALRRYPEAERALVELLAEGGELLKPEVKAAAEATIADLRRLIATVRVRMVSGGKPIAGGGVVLVDGEVAPTPDEAGAIRLGAGAHVIAARAPGYKDSVPRTVELAGGQRDVDVELELWPEATLGALLVVRADPGATVWVDGVLAGTGPWVGAVAPGAHVVKVRTPDGQVLVEEPLVAPGGHTEVSLIVPTAAPDRYESSLRATSIVKEWPWYVRLGGAVSLEPLTLAPAAGEPSATSRTFVGPSFAFALGRRLPIDFLAVEAYGEVGTAYASFTASQGGEARARVDRWMIAPVLRASTRGRLRVFGGVGVGFAGRAVGVTTPGLVDPRSGSETREASGIDATMLVDGGAAYGFGRVSVELAALGELHGVGSVKDGAGERYLLASPAIRGGGRLGLAVAF